jgi:hypothetical protein
MHILIATNTHKLEKHGTYQGRGPSSCLAKQAGPRATNKTWEKLDISSPVWQIEAAEKKLKAFVLLIANRQPWH